MCVLRHSLLKIPELQQLCLATTGSMSTFADWTTEPRMAVAKPHGKVKRGPGQAGPGDKTSKTTYLSPGSLTAKIATPSQALAESQGMFELKVASMNMGSRGTVTQKKKLGILGRLWGRGSLFYIMDPPQKNKTKYKKKHRKNSDFPWEFLCEWSHEKS